MPSGGDAAAAGEPQPEARTARRGAWLRRLRHKVGEVNRPVEDLVARVSVPIQTKLLVGFLVVVGLLILVGALGLHVLNLMNDRTRMLIGAETRIGAYSEIQRDTSLLFAHVSSSLWLSNEETRSAVTEELALFRRHIGRLKPGDAAEARLIDELAAEYERFAAAVKEELDLIARGNIDQAAVMQMDAAQGRQTALDTLIKMLVAKAQARMLADIAASDDAYRAARTMLIVFAVGAILFGLYFGRTISRIVIRPINEIQAGLGRIADGDFGQPVNVPNCDELGTLAARVNHTSGQLDRLYRELEAASRHKSAFLANMSHELRTPLNAIIGYSEMLLEVAEEEGGEESVADLQKIRDAGRHLLRLISDILDMSKIEAGRMEVFREEVDLVELFKEVGAIVEPLATAHGDDFRAAGAAEVGTLYTDRTKLKQMLLNLLSNASKFTRNGRITLAAAQAGTEVSFRVSDTGVGMNAEQLGRLFEAFSQADATTTRHYGGTGLGLAITKNFSEMLGGRVTVESWVGEGSTFTITLPRRAAPDAAAAAWPAPGGPPLPQAAK